MRAVGAVRQAVASLDPELLLGDVVAMPDRVARSLQPRRAPMLLSLGFGGVALLLAAIGIYGVLAYQVSQRTREIGIRMTLGSDAGGILRLIFREGAALVLIGLVAGAGGALALRQVIASQLYGVGALDPLVLSQRRRSPRRRCIPRLSRPGAASGPRRSGRGAGAAIADRHRSAKGFSRRERRLLDRKFYGRLALVHVASSVGGEIPAPRDTGIDRRRNDSPGARALASWHAIA